MLWCLFKRSRLPGYLLPILKPILHPHTSNYSAYVACAAVLQLQSANTKKNLPDGYFWEGMSAVPTASAPHIFRAPAVGAAAAAATAAASPPRGDGAAASTGTRASSWQSQQTGEQAVAAPCHLGSLRAHSGIHIQVYIMLTIV